MMFKSLFFTLLLSIQLLVAKTSFNADHHYASWGILHSNESPRADIDVVQAWQNIKIKKSVIVAVIDTGIDHNHPFLKNNNYIQRNKKANSNNYGKDFSVGAKNQNTPFDSHEHGTHVSSIIKSIHPEVQLLHLKYYNPNATGAQNLDSTLKALEYAIDMGVDIINYSGGGPESSQVELNLLRKAQAKGILVVAAAGNERSNIDISSNAYYPASYGLSNIISVGAHDQSLKIISSSNWGERSVDVAAPGYKIRAAIPNRAAGYMTGTSQATAFVSGVAALIKSAHPDLSYQQIKNIIIASSDEVKNFKNKILGAGKLNAFKAVSLANKVMQKIAASTKVANKTKSPSSASKS